MDSNRMEDIVIHYLFPNIYTYISKYYCKIFVCLLFNISMITHDKIFEYL